MIPIQCTGCMSLRKIEDKTFCNLKGWDELKENEPCLYYCTEEMMKEAVLEQLAMMREETDDPEEIERMDKVYKDITSKEPSDRAKKIIESNIKEVKFTTL